MKTLAGFCFALLLAAGLFAQPRGGAVNNGQPFVQGSFGSVVHPAGNGVSRSFPSVVNPGGGGPRLIVPNANFNTRPGQNFERRNFGRGSNLIGIPYAYPVYVGGGGYDNSYMSPDAGAMPPQQQQPNVLVIYPQQQQATPVIITLAPDGQYTTSSGQPNQPGFSPPGAYQPPVRPQVEEEPASTLEPAHYLIAFKDHTIYSAVAYWVDRDTLHYFTSGNVHNQVSLALVDRDLTLRLNKESGLDVKLPAPAKE